MSEPRTFTCAACGGVFDEGSDEEARAEAIENFGTDPHAVPMAVVCDDCYQAMTTALPPKQWREQKGQ